MRLAQRHCPDGRTASSSRKEICVSFLATGLAYYGYAQDDIEVNVLVECKVHVFAVIDLIHHVKTGGQRL